MAQQGGGFLRQAEHIGLLSFAGRADADAQHRDIGAHHGQSGHQARVRSGAAGRGDDAVDFQARLIGLGDQFQRTFGIAQRADGVRPAAGDHIGPPAARGDFGGDQGQLGDHVGPARHGADLRAQQFVQQHIAGAVVVGGVGARAGLQDDLARQAEPGGGGGGLADMVRLHCALGDQGVGVVGQRIAQQIFELAGLVAAARQAGAVVALDPQRRPAAVGPREVLGQTGQRLERGRQVGEADGIEAGEVHGWAVARLWRRPGVLNA